MIPTLFSLPFAVFGMLFQMSFITIGKAGLGAILSVLGGVINIVLDWLFIAIFNWGLLGAAIATGIGYALPSVIGLILFCVNRKVVLYVVKPKWRLKTILHSCANGSSEMVSVLAFSVITVLFNRILMGISGSDGVASLTIIWYAQGLFGGVFRGYINGISSVVSYNFGKGDKERLSKLFKISIWSLAAAGILVTAISYIFDEAVISVFAKGNAQVEQMAMHGYKIVATSFIMMAYNVFSSGWFTALNDGRTSAILSFCRTMIFMVLPVLILPKIWGLDGVWISLTISEMLGIIMTLYYFIKFKGVWTPEK